MKFATLSFLALTVAVILASGCEQPSTPSDKKQSTDTYILRASGDQVVSAYQWNDLSRFVIFTDNSSYYTYTVCLINADGEYVDQSEVSGNAGEVRMPPAFHRLNSDYAFTKTYPFTTFDYEVKVTLYDGMTSSIASRSMERELPVETTLTNDDGSNYFLLTWYEDYMAAPDHLFIESVNSSLETINSTELPNSGNLTWPMWAHRLPDSTVLVETANNNGGVYYARLNSQGTFVDSTSYTGRSPLTDTHILSDGTIVGLSNGALVAIDSGTLETKWTYGTGIGLYRLTSDGEIVTCSPNAGAGLTVTFLASDGSVIRTKSILEDVDTFSGVPGFDLASNGYFIIGAQSATEDKKSWLLRTDAEGNFDY